MPLTSAVRPDSATDDARGGPRPGVFAALVAIGTVVTVGVIALGLVVHDHVFLDLDVYRIGVHTWWHGGNMYGDLPPTSIGTSLPFIYPPFAAGILSPLALLPWSAAWVSTGLLSVLCMGIVLYVVARRLRPSWGTRGAFAAALLALPVALVLEPVRSTLWFGQVNLILMALVALDCLVEHPKWPRGALVGIAAAIKLTPAAFLLYFLLRKDFRTAVVTVISGVVCTAIGFAVAFHASVQYWFGSVPGVSGISGSPFATNQTFKAELVRLALPKTVQTGLWGLLILLALALAVVAMWHALRNDDPAMALCVNGVLALLVSPTSWNHHWVYIAPALFIVLITGVRRRSPTWLAAFVVAAVVFVIDPFSRVPQNDGRELHWSLWQGLLGNSYLIVGSLGLVMVAIPAIRALLAARRTTPATTG